MSHSTTPVICLAATACMIAAGASHWWSVQQLTRAIDPVTAPASRVAPATAAAVESETPPRPSPELPVAEVPRALAPAPPVGESLATQQQFYQELIREMQQLRTQNRDLLNQVAETNRDLMKLEFRVDTHSEQFRPLPVAEDRFGTTLDTTFDTSFGDGPGLLPPRAVPVDPQFAE